MWALRRASNSFKSGALNKHCFRACGSRTGTAARFFIEDDAKSLEHLETKSDRSVSLKRLYVSPHEFPNSFTGIGGSHRFLSSQASTKSSDCESKNDLEDVFAELENQFNSDVRSKEVESENELVLESELSAEEDSDDGDESNNGLESLDTETDGSAKVRKLFRKSLLFKKIMAAPGLSVGDVMDKWVEEGNEVTRSEVAQVMGNLRRHRMHGKALQLIEWLDSSKKLEFTLREYVAQLDLIAKVRGIQKAESYIDNIPKSFRSEVIYRTLLANCVISTNVKKAEEVFKKISITSFSCNLLLILYRRVNKKKIANILLLMEKEDVKPSLLTYKILIDVKANSNDTDGMDKILEEMMAEGLEPDLHMNSAIARHYALAGLNEKAEAVLKKMEGGDLKENRLACRYLLPLYAAIGKADEVNRVWMLCMSKPTIEEFKAAIEAFGQLKKIDEAEAVFDKMCKIYTRLSSRYYTTLLKVYANHKMLSKGKNLVKRMRKSGFTIGPLTWDALVQLHVEAGKIRQAHSILFKAARENGSKHLFSSYMRIMDRYASRGDVYNAEKMFHRMRQVGYFVRQSQYQCLVKAYIIGKKPAYGIRERMKADNVFPNKELAAQLPLVDACRRTALSDLLAIFKS